VSEILKISIVIPNYNGAHCLGRCIEAAQKALRSWADRGEIIVVDDASTDDSLAIVQAKFPEIRMQPQLLNQGFSKTCNVGAALAQGEWILFLNNDCYLSENYLQKIFEKLPSFPVTLFSVMGGIYNLNDQLVDSAKFPETRTGGLWRGLKSTLNVESGEVILPTLFSSGCNAMVNAQKFRELGGFDERFSPFYLEDVDLGLSGWRQGWSSFYVPQAKCIHEGSKSIGQISTNYVRVVSKRNRWLLHFKHLPFFSLMMWAFIHGLELLFGVIFRPHFYAPLIVQIIRLLPKMMCHRVRYLKCTSDVVADITAKIRESRSIKYF
jgi:GT2 family glycosyltransferase